MNLKYVLQDASSQHPQAAGQSLNVQQGEIKVINVYLFDGDGVPFSQTSPGEVVVKIFRGLSVAPIQKLFSASEVALLSGLGGVIGFSFGLTQAETASLPVSDLIGMTATFEDTSVTPTVVSEQDFPNCLNVSASLVP